MDRNSSAWTELCARWEGRCAYCGKQPASLVREHVEPISRGGADEPENIVPSCAGCNSSKGDFLLLEWVLVQTGNWARAGRGNSFRNVRLSDSHSEPLECWTCGGPMSVWEPHECPPIESLDDVIALLAGEAETGAMRKRARFAAAVAVLTRSPLSPSPDD